MATLRTYYKAKVRAARKAAAGKYIHGVFCGIDAVLLAALAPLIHTKLTPRQVRAVTRQFDLAWRASRVFQRLLDEGPDCEGWEDQVDAEDRAILRRLHLDYLVTERWGAKWYDAIFANTKRDGKARLEDCRHPHWR